MLRATSIASASRAVAGAATTRGRAVLGATGVSLRGRIVYLPTTTVNPGRVRVVAFAVLSLVVDRRRRRNVVVPPWRRTFVVIVIVDDTWPRCVGASPLVRRSFLDGIFVDDSRFHAGFHDDFLLGFRWRGCLREHLLGLGRSRLRRRGRRRLGLLLRQRVPFGLRVLLLALAAVVLVSPLVLTRLLLGRSEQPGDEPHDQRRDEGEDHDDDAPPLDFSFLHGHWPPPLNRLSDKEHENEHTMH